MYVFESVYGALGKVCIIPAVADSELSCKLTRLAADCAFTFQQTAHFTHVHNHAGVWRSDND